MPALILASTSPYRNALLQRLELPFSNERPDVDEAPLLGEAPAAMAYRLAVAKAQAVALRHPGTWVIGSDQVAELEGRPLGKPGNTGRAHSQLQSMAGKTVKFHTAVALACDNRLFTAIDLTQVSFRALSIAEIQRYVAAEQPLDCAGSFKCEGLGITLFEAIENTDPTALIGLPLIALSRLLREAGYTLP